MQNKNNPEARLKDLLNRRKTLFTSSISGDKEGEFYILGERFTEFLAKRSFFEIVGCMWLGKGRISKELEKFVELVLKLAVDHGPYVSGAVNTIITARAGKDLVSSLSAGLLSIGPRFGGAVNSAAEIFLRAVRQDKQPAVLVEEFARNKRYIPGIGHRKYRVDMPDPRVDMLIDFVRDRDFEKKTFLNFAKEVERITARKKPNLILNVDGTIAAVGLDIFYEKEKLSFSQLERLLKTEIFNAFFVLSRTVGFIAHFLDQKRLGESMFRLEEGDVFLAERF